MPEPQRVLVTDKETGQESYVPLPEVDPARHELAAGQVATIDPFGTGGDISAGQVITERELQGGLFEPVSPETRLELTQDQVESDVFDSASNTVSQYFRGGLAGGTFGISELFLRPDDPFELERQRRFRAAGGSAFGTGQIVGAIIPGLLSGGTGALGTLARLTPVGRVGAVAGRIAASGRGLAGRVAAGATASAIEGAAQGVGDYLAAQSLQENPNFSAEALASSAALGGLVGGVVGGATPALGALGQRVARLRGRRAQPISDLAFDETAALRALEHPQLADDIPFDRLVSPRQQRATGEAFGDLVAHVDDVAQRSVRATREEIPDILQRLDDAGIDRSLRDGIVGQLEKSADDLRQVSQRSSLWTDQARRQLDPDAIGTLSARNASKQLPDAFDDLGADMMAELDHVTTKHARSVQTVQESLAEAVEAANLAAQASPEVIGTAAVGERVRGITDRFRQALANRGTTIETIGRGLGAVEIARDLGVDVPSARDLPGVGDAVSIWARWKAGANALRKTGVLPASRASRAAVAVNDKHSRFQAFVSRASRGVVARATSPLGKDLGRRSAITVGQELVGLRARRPEQVAADTADAVARQAPDLAPTAGAAAARAHAYLLSQAPRNPLQGTLAEDDWRPSAVERAEWGVTVAAVRDPVAAIESSLSDPYPDRAIAAVRAVYPAMFADMQQRLLAEADKLRRRLPLGRLQALGRVFQLPLTISQQPTYQAVFESPLENEPLPGTPRASTTSPLGTLEMTGTQRRAVRVG